MAKHVQLLQVELNKTFFNCNYKTSSMILVIFSIIIAFIVYNTIYTNKKNTTKYTVTCDSKDISCKMYNHLDIDSKCTSMCLKKYPNSTFDGNHTELPDGSHKCECTPEKEQFISIGDFDKPILGNTIQTDLLFSNRNYVEKVQKDRLQKLIFG